MRILGHGAIIRVLTQEIQVVPYWQHDEEWNNISTCEWSYMRAEIFMTGHEVNALCVL
jgi:hypothetical protein